ARVLDERHSPARPVLVRVLPPHDPVVDLGRALSQLAGRCVVVGEERGEAAEVRGRHRDVDPRARAGRLSQRSAWRHASVGCAGRCAYGEDVTSDDRDEFGVYHRHELWPREDGSVQVRTETNDDDDDGYPDGAVESWLLTFPSLESAIRHTGVSRRGY